MPAKKEKKEKETSKKSVEKSEEDNLFFMEETDCENILDNFEEKRESLLVLATLGMTKEYLGQEIGVEKIHKLTKKNIEKLFNRYQQVQGKKVSQVLISKGIQLGVKLISYVVPIKDTEKLISDLENDQLVTRELSSQIGYLVLKGGRFVALASGLVQVANNVLITDRQIQKKTVIVDYVDTTETS